MRPQHVELHRAADLEGASHMSVVASASFRPRGPGYDPRIRLRRRLVALRGGKDAIVLAFTWVDSSVRVQVVSPRTRSSEEIERAIATGRSIAALDDDPTTFVSMVRSHPLLGPLSRRIDARIGTTTTVFESFTIAVIEQLVTGFEARASIRRLWRIAGEPVPGTKLFAAPTPTAVKRVPMWRMHAIGVGSRRAATLREGAGRGESIERLRDVPPAAALEKLQSLPGVGAWTANAVARGGLGWPDAVPVGDFHAPFTITEALGGSRDLSRDEPEVADRALLEILEPFRPHRARVAILLERHQLAQRRWRLPRVDLHRREPWRY